MTRALTALRHAARSYSADAAVIAGVALVGFGADRLLGGLGPIAWGVGLILVIRFGATPVAR